MKNVYIDKLDDIFHEYNNAYHRANKMKPINVRSSTYINFEVKNSVKDLKFDCWLCKNIKI